MQSKSHGLSCGASGFRIEGNRLVPPEDSGGFISSIDHKPAFKAIFDPPGTQDSGRSAGRFLFWRYGGPMSPREQLRMPHYTNRRSK